MSDSVNVISDEMSKLVYDATDAAINWACAVERDIDVDSKALAAMQAQKILVQAIAKLEAENAALKAEPKPLAYWSDEKKQTYADNEGRSTKGARNE